MNSRIFRTSMLTGSALILVLGLATDRAHAAHCDNEACVMFWLNEGFSDLRQYVEDYVTTGDTVIFDDACLADTRAAAQ